MVNQSELQQQVAALSDRVTHLEQSGLIQFRLSHPEFEVINLADEKFTIGAIYTCSRKRLAEVEEAIAQLRKVSSWQYDSLVAGLL
jgi:hypothetical protein